MHSQAEINHGASKDVNTRFKSYSLMVCNTEETDREAHAHTAIVFLAPLEKYLAALGPDSLAPLSKLHCKNDHL